MKILELEMENVRGIRKKITLMRNLKPPLYMVIPTNRLRRF